MNARIVKASSLACKLGVLSREIGAAASRLLQPFGITPSQANLLLHLLQGETSPSKIAGSTGIDASSLSRLTRTLEAKGWITRATDLDNRSRVSLSLTAEGDRMARSVAPHAEHVQQRVLEALDEREQAALHAAINKISRAMASHHDLVRTPRSEPPPLET